MPSTWTIITGPIYASIDRSDICRNLLSELECNIFDLSMESLLGILTRSLVAVLAIYLLWRFLTSSKNLPPGPFAWPFIGSMPSIGPYPPRGLAKLAGKYGPLMSVWMGHKLVVVATTPETAMEFVRTQDANFCGRPKYQSTAIIMPHDITFSDVTPHSKHLRKVVQTQFSTSQRIEAADQLRQAEFTHLVRIIPCEGVVNLRSYMEVVVGNIFSQLVMSKRLLQPRSCDDAVSHAQQREGVDDAKKLKDLMTITTEIDQCIGTFNLGDVIPAFKSWDLQGLKGRFQLFRARMESFIAVIIDERLQERKQATSYESKDYLDTLLDEADDKSNEIDLNTVRTMIWQVYGAGMETTIASSEWVMTELVQNPSVMAIAQRELDTVVGRDRLVTSSDLRHLPYINAIVKESFRLHPPIPFLARKSLHPCKAFGYDIPAGTNVFVNLWGIGRLERIYPDAMRFSPERFLPGGKNEKLDLQGQSFELLPFGTGRRICPGMQLGSTVFQTAVATLLHAFEWGKVEGHAGVEGMGRATLYKRVPLEASAKRRLAPGVYTTPENGC